MIELNSVNHMKAEDLLDALPEASIDLIVTSPPYDNLRTYKGFEWDFEKIAAGSYRVLKPGGVLVWVVGDATIEGSETLSSFDQAVYFRRGCGFNLWDTMIYLKNGSAFPSVGRYSQVFEYMFVFSKDKPTTFNAQMEKSRWGGEKRFGKQSSRSENGELIKRDLPPINTLKVMDNVWRIDNGFGFSSKDKLAFEHPATFPEELAERHILTWSNPGDVVLDYFGGSGTTAKMARQNGRHYITGDISAEYCELMRKRLAQPFTLPMFAEASAQPEQPTQTQFPTGGE